MSAAGPVREGERLLSVAALGGSPVAVLVLHDPAGTAADTERVAVEHATTVLTMEIARLQHLAQGEARTRINLVLDLVGDTGAEPATLLNRAQALGYDLVRPHRVVVVEAAGAHRDDDIDMFFHAVGRAARAAGVGSLLAPRLHDVIVLADAEVPWDRFWARVVTEMHGGRCRIGVGGRVLELDRLPAAPARKRSWRCGSRRRRAAPSGSRCSTTSASTRSWPRRATRRPWSAS